MTARLATGVLLAITAFAWAGASQAQSATSELIEFEFMTWKEIKAALAAGKTTALIYTGGTEQRGPQNATGGHNLLARGMGLAIAQRLGNAILMPVVPYSPARPDPELPGNIGLSPKALGIVVEEIAEQTILNGFKNIILLADSGGGQPAVYEEVAKKLDAKYAPQGARVFYADHVYRKANRENGEWLVSQGYPRGTHGGIADTSLMMYFDVDGKYVRKNELPNALGDPVLEPGQERDPNYKPVRNGINGDARRASAELGKRLAEHKVNVVVKQIQAFLGSSAEK